MKPGPLVIEQHGQGLVRHMVLFRVSETCARLGNAFLFVSKTHAAVGNIREKIEQEMQSKTEGFSFVSGVELVDSGNAEMGAYVLDHIDDEQVLILCGTLDSYIHGMVPAWPPVPAGEDTFLWKAEYTANLETPVISKCFQSIASGVSEIPDDLKHILETHTAIMSLSMKRRMAWYYPAAVAKLCSLGASVSGSATSSRAFTILNRQVRTSSGRLIRETMPRWS